MLIEKIRTIPDYPKPGISFHDITTLLKDAEAFQQVINVLKVHYQAQSTPIDVIVGIEARGFIIGSALAYALKTGFVPIRKSGKLPAKVASAEYALEYGVDRIEIHTDAITPGCRVLLVDDLIATGGTALAAADLIEQLQGQVVGAAFIINLPTVGGAAKLQARHYPVFCLAELAG